MDAGTARGINPKYDGMQKNMSISKGVTVLVTGATGAIGPRVVHALCVAGYLVRTFSLDTPETELFPPNVDEHIGDITDPSAVQSAMQGVDAVIHLAALLHITNPPLPCKKSTRESTSAVGFRS